ncbi:glutathione S-transferase E14-like [Anastrepha ludens]|uniref:glutathione S-transferase E14-like n=1 Tax=Anastrepha ludens TaxID=28586 RepID=UPI0023AE8069|nr:glutathione S-transferase E14-like [Anastrepha ludens]
MSKLLLYYDDVSPPVRSCMLLIELLGLDVEYKYLDLFKGDQLDKAFLELNPNHTVPTLVHNDLVITDSHPILMHICEKFEKSNEGEELWPRNYEERIRVLNMLFFECSVLFRRDSEFLSAIVRGGFDSVNFPLHERKLLEAYNMLESYLRRHKYMACDRMTIADISIVTTLSTVNLMFPIAAGAADKWPLLNDWFERMRALPMYHINQTGLEKLRAVIERIGKFKFPTSKIETSKCDKKQEITKEQGSDVKQENVDENKQTDIPNDD